MVWSTAVRSPSNRLIRGPSGRWLTSFGEVLALTGDDVQPYTDNKTGKHRVGVAINAHLIYEEGKGIRRVPGRKGNRPGILVRVPDWSEDMWLRRKQKAGRGPIFPAVGGGRLDQNNCNKRLRAALDGAGFEWVPTDPHRTRC